MADFDALSAENPLKNPPDGPEAVICPLAEPESDPTPETISTGICPGEGWPAFLGPFPARLKLTRPAVRVRPEDGAFFVPIWRKGWHWTIVAREDAWVVSSNWFLHATGYVVRNHHKRLQYLHRLVCWCRLKGAVAPVDHWFMNSAIQPDHDDRNRQNNHRKNLILVDQTMNNWNQSVRLGDDSDRREQAGITWDADRELWMAKTKHRGKEIYVGRFIGLRQAENALTRVKAKLMREHRREIAGELAHAADVPF